MESVPASQPGQESQRGGPRTAWPTHCQASQPGGRRRRRSGHQRPAAFWGGGAEPASWATECCLWACLLNFPSATELKEQMGLSLGARSPATPRRLKASNIQPSHAAAFDR